jgi:hypothetical protein
MPQQPLKFNPLQLFTCEVHGRQRAFAVCLCVVKSISPVNNVIYNSREHTLRGEIYCKRENHRLEEMVPVCEVCVKAKGMNKLGAMVK